MVVPLFVKRADIGAHCLERLHHLRLKMDIFSFYLPFFIY